MSDLISREEVLNLIDTAFESGAFDGRYAYENLIDAVQNLIHPLEADLISRQEAIDAVINLWADKPFGNPALVEIKDCIEALPPVTPQPEKHTEERAETHACDCISRETHVCDCISRQAARNALLNKGQHSKRYKLGETWELNLMEIEETLGELPSVEPERKLGKWIRTIDPDVNAWTGGHICSECGRACVQMSMNYCANCGTPMEVETDHS